MVTILSYSTLISIGSCYPANKDRRTT